jgi:3-hydroxyacyl-CoA dehydrogenase
MNMSGYSRAAVIGTGMMGPGIAVSFALGGLDAAIVSRDPAGAESGLEKARRQLGELADHCVISKDEAAQALPSSARPPSGMPPVPRPTSWLSPFLRSWS